MKTNRFLPGLVLFIVLVLATGPAQAHKVNIFAYSEGDIIFTESYFPDGRKVQGGKIEVYDKNGAKLIEGVTNKEGAFNFKTPKKEDLKIVLIATLGHKNSFLIRAEEIETVAAQDKTGTPAVESPPQKANHDGSPQASVVESSKSSTRKPRQHMEPPKESNVLAILAGLGFIFGLSYLMLHFTKKDKS